MHTARPRMDDGRERDDDALLAHIEFTVDRVGRESIPNPTVFAVLIFPKHPRQPLLRLVGGDHAASTPDSSEFSGRRTGRPAIESK